MKLSINKRISSMLPMLAAGIVTLSALTSQAEAGVVWTFAQDGANVTATVGGSFSIDVVSAFSNSVTTNDVSNNFLYSIDGSFAGVGSVGTPTFISRMIGANAGSGTFGHNNDFLYWDGALGTTLTAGTDVASGATVASFTWNDTTIDTIFFGGTLGGFFDNGPVIAWTLNGGAATDTISYAAYVAPVPEPSSSALLVGLGTLALLARRKR
jgi:hypothetical protein